MLNTSTLHHELHLGCTKEAAELAAPWKTVSDWFELILRIMPDACVAMDAAVDVAVKRVMEHADFASKFKHPVKFNGTDFVEERLTAEQQLAEVTRSASQQMHVFLERYGSLLCAEDLRALAGCPAAETAEDKEAPLVYW
ncbi:hypothetical protein AK812_SmicGene37878 [Symbiodinium microadriaticum]|uniref:Uncharacterized protein n=1 Tax=Symbiodinium microadriaticum TaxID=2951 RepID=A0A1Q9CF92_SYMMI|nr:hypothetical protein AK812_SmicGene37878 [Symbiodinium microadriaticum]